NIPGEKQNIFILETGNNDNKIVVSVDEEFFNIRFQSSSNINPYGEFSVHERCIK
ncbi:unnamed protein product, partial [Rotaria sp. Silwood1]